MATRGSIYSGLSLIRTFSVAAVKPTRAGKNFKYFFISSPEKIIKKLDAKKSVHVFSGSFPRQVGSGLIRKNNQKIVPE